MELTGYGRSTGFCIDPIEKKPLNHFLPGSSVLSFGTAGCNLACSFCQNWDISKSREVAALSALAMPETIARAAQALGCRASPTPTTIRSSSWNTRSTRRPPAARGASRAWRSPPALSATRRGAPSSRPWTRRTSTSRASPSASTQRCAGPLKPVLDTLVHLVHETNVWTEITTLLIPGENDSDEELDALTRWAARTQARRSPPLHRLPSRLSHAGNRADAFGDAAKSARHRHQERASSCLCRQRPRSGAPGDAVPGVRGARDRPRRLHDHGLRAGRFGRVLTLRDENGGRIRREARRMGLAAACGRHRALRGVRATWRARRLASQAPARTRVRDARASAPKPRPDRGPRIASAIARCSPTEARARRRQHVADLRHDERQLQPRRQFAQLRDCRRAPSRRRGRRRSR